MGPGGEPPARAEGLVGHTDGLEMETPKRTPLHQIHLTHGAKLVPFGGYEMPVSYPGGITAEHRAVREHVGVFDVSHMGEFEVTGPDRNAFVQRVTCNDVGALRPGQAQYSAILTEQGTFVDDCLVYRFDDRLMLVVNAANIAADWAHIVAQKRGANVRLRDISDATALLAVQGPEAEAKVVARHGYEVYLDGPPVDVVRSGTVTPTVNCAIGMTYLPVAEAKPGTRFTIDVRGKRAPAEVVPMPFVARKTKGR